MNTRMGVIVHGRVQGVAFRHHTLVHAQELGVTGWVRNLPDGSVAGLFEGAEADVRALVGWCRNGPPASRVERVEVHSEPYRGEFDDFRITF